MFSFLPCSSPGHFDFLFFSTAFTAKAGTGVFLNAKYGGVLFYLWFPKRKPGFRVENELRDSTNLGTIREIILEQIWIVTEMEKYKKTHHKELLDCTSSLCKSQQLASKYPPYLA